MTDINNSKPIDSPGLAAQVGAFIRSYLDCGDHELTMLVLWVLHTHCFAAARTTPYLNICSAESQCGKTLCLQLLSVLCDRSWYAAAPSPSVLVRKITSACPTVLLDQRDLLFGGDFPRLRGLLINGARRGATWSLSEGRKSIQDADVFCPKAFAGDTVLPAAFNCFCVPITLYQKFFDPNLRKFDLPQARTAAQPLFERLRHWAAEAVPRLQEHPAFDFDQDQCEEVLLPRQQDCAEPLLLIAEFLGGEWPLKAWTAFVKLFEAHSEHEHIYVEQLLADVRAAFEVIYTQRYLHGLIHDRDVPLRLSTQELLDFLNDRQERPWNTWNDGRPLTARNLGRLLGRIGVHSRSQRHDSENRGRGYDQDDFKTHFEGLHSYDKRNNESGWKDPI